MTYALSQTPHTFIAQFAFDAVETFMTSQGWPDWDIKFSQQRLPVDGYNVELYGLSGEFIGYVAPAA